MSVVTWIFLIFLLVNLNAASPHSQVPWWRSLQLINLCQNQSLRWVLMSSRLELCDGDDDGDGDDDDDDDDIVDDDRDT